MQRRAFLAAAGASLLTSRLARASRDPAPWHLGCRIASYGDYQNLAWTHLPSLGVSRIFLEAPPPEGIDALRKRLQAHALRTPVLGAHVPLAQPDALARLDTHLATCKALGAGYMFLSANHDKITKEAAYDLLRQAGDAAAKHDVTLVLETHPRLGTNAATHLETMRQVNHPRVRVNFDTGNLSYYNESISAVKELEQIIEYVATVELKDHDLKPKSWHFPALGEGRVDFPGLFRVLDAHQFAGPVTIEIEGIAGQPWSEAETKHAVETSVRFVRGLHPFD